MTETISAAADSRKGVVVLIGKFARFPRHELAERLRGAGVRVDREVTAEAECVVMGGKSPPLRGNSRIPRSLLVAHILRDLRQTPEVLEERQFIERYPQLLREFGNARAQASGKCDSRATRPASAVDANDCRMNASFSEWKRAQLIACWLARGTSIRRVRRALRQLGSWLPDARAAWERLAPAWDGRRLLLRMDDGRLVESTGQLLFDDAPRADCGAQTLRLPVAESADPFATAVKLEQQGEFAAAECAYRALLQREGPVADLCFNLANVLMALGRRQAALERLWECVELAPQFAEAWHNLASVALELRQIETAALAFTRALELKPGLIAAAQGLELTRNLHLLVEQ